MIVPDYTSLPPHEALLKAQEALGDLLSQAQTGRIHNADRSRIPEQVFTLAAIMDYLVLMVKIQQEEIQVLHEKVRYLQAR